MRRIAGNPGSAPPPRPKLKHFKKTEQTQTIFKTLIQCQGKYRIGNPNIDVRILAVLLIDYWQLPFEAWRITSFSNKPSVFIMFVSFCVLVLRLKNDHLGIWRMSNLCMLCMYAMYVCLYTPSDQGLGEQVTSHLLEDSDRRTLPQPPITVQVASTLKLNRERYVAKTVTPSIPASTLRQILVEDPTFL